MSVLIRDQNVVADTVITLADEDALPSDGAVLVSWDRWQTEREHLLATKLSVGVQIPNTLDLADSAPTLLDRPLIALSFPAFGDGRAYSQARLLRDRYRYRGEIRACGQAVVRDQLQGMWRSGINSFALRPDQDPAACLQAFADFSAAYQPATDELVPVFVRRRGHAAPAG